MNLHVEGSRPAIVTVKGQEKTITDRTSFSLWQTPTSVTREILAMPEDQHLEGYKAWARANCQPYEEDVYAADDVFCDGEPIGKKMVNPCDDHLNELMTWHNMCADEDYTVRFYEL